MKQAIQIGAGNIGRGFIGALLAQAGWQVTATRSTSWTGNPAKSPLRT